MREIARVAQGHFPTQPRIVAAIAELFDLPQHGTVTVLDAGCGCGDAMAELRTAWLPRATTETEIRLYGIESDHERCRQAQERFSNLGGETVWSPIEDCDVHVGASLLWFNPPYDRIRGAGRVELSLFSHVKNWCAHEGVLVLIVPDYVLADPESGLAVAIERQYHRLALFRYPEPDYQQFKQCVFIGRRRDRSLTGNRVAFPAWAGAPDQWSVLSSPPPTVRIPLRGVEPLNIRLSQLSDDRIRSALENSPIRSSLLREALAPAPAIERPLLPLKAGHLALALAGGLCDGVVEKNGVRFLVKGTLSRKTCQTHTTEKLDAQGQKIADVDIFRTVYAMNVRCLRADGSIENYTSNDSEDEARAPQQEVQEEGKEA